MIYTLLRKRGQANEFRLAQFSDSLFQNQTETL